jgi:hypothetical protein
MATRAGNLTRLLVDSAGEADKNIRFYSKRVAKD